MPPPTATRRRQLRAGGCADLYYRLATAVLRIPPLRERGDDILPLAQHFLERFAAEFRRPAVAFSPAAQEALVKYAWPGNVRELRNVIERATMLSDSGKIGPDDLDLPVLFPPPSAAGGDVGDDATGLTRLDDTERRHIERVLRATGGSRTRAASLLGISRSTLWDKIKRYGLDQ